MIPRDACRLVAPPKTLDQLLGQVQEPERDRQDELDRRRQAGRNDARARKTYPDWRWEWQALGSDPLGREILDRLGGLGLPTDGISTDPSAPTGTVSVELDGQGKPKFTIHEGVAWDFLEAGLPRQLHRRARPRAAGRAGTGKNCGMRPSDSGLRLHPARRDAAHPGAGAGSRAFPREARLTVLHAVPLLPVIDEAKELGRNVLTSGLLPVASDRDATHIALASAYEMEILPQ